MPRFRRPGLAEDDDGAEVRPEAINQARRNTLPYSQPTTRINRVPAHAMCDEESVISGLSATSDLDSLYLESSKQKTQYANDRDKHLLYQRLPGQFGNNESNPTLLKENGSNALLSGFIDENDNEDNWEDVVFAATRLPASERTPRKSNSDQLRSTNDPYFEQERGNIENSNLKPERVKKSTPQNDGKREKRSSTKNKTTIKEGSSDARRSSIKTKSKKTTKKKVGDDEVKDQRKSGNNGDTKRKSVKNAQLENKSKVDPPGKENKPNKPKSFRFSLKGLKSPIRSKSPMRLKTARE
jgi:hypothetical protein